MNEPITIVDRGRGLQLSTSRITVLDVFYYMHRGYDYDAVRRAMPTLSREEFDTITAYVNAHRDELIEADRRAEDAIRRGIEDQKAKGLYPNIDESLPVEKRVGRLRAQLRQRRAEKNRDRAAG